MLHEAQSIQKAIEQAWTAAGNPSEFTIKVLDAGEKGLLWFVKRPAIVSISYDPKRNPGKSSESAPHQKQSFKKNNERNRTPKNDKVEREERFQQRQLKETNATQALAPRQQPEQKNKRPNNAQQTPVAASNKQSQPPVTQELQVITWTPDAVEHVSNSLREFVPILQLPANFSTEVDNKLLRIVFDKKLMPSADEEKMLCIGLSYILMQFLKKNYKKKFKGFQIILTAKSSSQHGDQTNNSSL